MAKEAVKIHEGDVIDYEATGAIANGDVVVFDANVGVAYDDAVLGDTIAVAMKGVFMIPANTTDVIAVGNVLYFHPTNREVTIVSAGAIACGTAVTAKAGATAGSVYVRLNG